MRCLTRFLGCLLFLLLPLQVWAIPTLDRLVDEALRNNPDLQAARARWQMVGHQEIPAGTLPDPQLSLSLVNLPTDTLAFDETPMSGKDIRLSQKFPFPGKLGTRRQMAEYQTLWYRHAWEDARLQLAGKVKQSWYRLYFLDRAIALTKKNLAVLDDVIRFAETRYAVGKGLQQDVLKAQVEHSRLTDRLLALQQQRRTTLERFNSLLARSPGQPMQTPERLQPETFALSEEQLRQLSRRNRPLNAAYRALIDRFKSKRRLAELDFRPDFTVWAGYRLRDEVAGDSARGQDFISGGVNLNLPVWQRKRHAQVAEADSAVRMARAQYEQFLNQVDFRLADAYARMAKNRDLIELYEKGLLPQAEQAYRASMAAYQVGKVEFLSLLDALMKLYRFQIDHERAVSEYQVSLAELETEAGLSVSDAGIDTPEQPKAD
ncbi:outer membrane protein TolC [Geothermobacter ehrlichii]|uniref:Outer membrane protein TolC n=1 Tax=Geothermobacter ehrlichii TaxID=213224 RepID=A0A5D3WLV5_9BACT|nr:TolC family protein [Geothermobacter ehrlichii]TYO98252.1 outer membrane protein TolC [Geothermobacter ehrlichii]